MLSVVGEETKAQTEEEVALQLQQEKQDLEHNIEATAKLIEQLWFYQYRNYQIPLQVLPVQIELIAKLQASSEQADIHLASYADECTRIMALSVQTYREYLEMKDQAVVDGKILALTTDKIDELVQEYQQHVRAQINNYTIERSILETDLQAYFSRLLSIKQKLDGSHSEVEEHKTIQTDRMEKFKNDYLTKYQKAYHLKIIEQQGDNFLALCEFGQIEKLKIYLARYVTQATRQNCVNRLWPMRQGNIDGFATRGLHMACYHGQLNIVHLLLQEGADPRLPDEEGYTPLHRLMMQPDHFNWQDIVSLILERYPTALDATGVYNRRPLHTAVHFGHVDAVNYLLKHGVNINAAETTIDCYGRTPLHVAVFRNNPYLVRLLLENGANIFILNKNGETPIVEAMAYQLTEIVEVFTTFINTVITRQCAKIVENIGGNEISVDTTTHMIAQVQGIIGSMQQMVLALQTATVVQVETPVSEVEVVVPVVKAEQPAAPDVPSTSDDVNIGALTQLNLHATRTTTSDSPEHTKPGAIVPPNEHAAKPS